MIEYIAAWIVTHIPNEAPPRTAEVCGRAGRVAVCWVW